MDSISSQLYRLREQAGDIEEAIGYWKERCKRLEVVREHEAKIRSVVCEGGSISQVQQETLSRSLEQYLKQRDADKPKMA